MRSPNNDLVAVWTSIGGGGIFPLVALLNCRSVPKDQIVNLQPPFNNLWGYLTYDPPNVITAGATSFGGNRDFAIDYRFANQLLVASIPGHLFFPVFIEEVTTATDHYFRVWIIEESHIP